MSQNKVQIVAAARTPVGSFCGSLSRVKAHALSSTVIEHLAKNINLNLSDVSEVIIGQALLAGQGQNPARQAAVNAGIPFSVPAFTVNKLCGSGLKSVILGCQSIKCGDANIIICGGQESMSQAPHCINMRLGVKMGNAALFDSMITDGLMDAFNNIHMGVTAENIAKQFNITREEQDEFALLSQKKAELAQQNYYFAKEIVPVSVIVKKSTLSVSSDEHPKHGTSIEGLKKLKPVFCENGTVTAGNSSGLNDGAAILILTSLEEANKKNLKPIAEIVGYSETGIEPTVMGLGPISAVKDVLKKCCWRVDDVDIFELNEAFAAQSIAVIRELELDTKKVNVNGGAIALGHPIGASGARILVTLIHALERTKGKKGIAALCIGGGMGIAVAIEMS